MNSIEIIQGDTDETPWGMGTGASRSMTVCGSALMLAAGELVEIADALTDLLYLVLGTYHSHGLQDIAAELFDEVHRSNMTKLGANGQPVLREDGKV